MGMSCCGVREEIGCVRWVDLGIFSAAVCGGATGVKTDRCFGAERELVYFSLNAF